VGKIGRLTFIRRLFIPKRIEISHFRFQKVQCKQGDHNLSTASWDEHQCCESHGASAIGASRRGSDLGVWGSVLGYPAGSGAKPGPPALFSYIQITYELIFCHRCERIRLQRWANRDKSGTPSQKGTNGRPGRTVIFFGTRRKEIGTVTENFGTDGHLKCR